MIEHWYLACMILVTSPFNWHHAVTLTFDLFQGRSCCRAGDHNFPNWLVQHKSALHCYVGIFRTYIVLLFISCTRLFFYFVDRFFSFLLSRAYDFCLFCMSFFSFLLSRAHIFFHWSFFFFSTISYIWFERDYFSLERDNFSLERDKKTLKCGTKTAS